jgi:hypothetical protein
MKLNPPASSSDLEIAREIARRLHQRRRRDDRPAPEAPAPARRPAPVTPRREAPPPPVPPLGPEAAPEPPSWDEPVGEPAPTPLDAPPEATSPEPLFGMTGSTETEAPDPDMDLGDAEAAGVSPEELVGSPGPPPFEDLPVPEAPAGEPSQFEVDLDEGGRTAEETFEAPPSWDDVALTVSALAGARAAMLADPAGRVFAACGEWPDPGPHAIATKLVATMDRTLRDAPTRSISAPLMGSHLTAWRVPLDSGLVTAAFIGDSPVGADVRPSIDAEILRASGS